MGLKRSRQLGLKIEAAEGVEETLTAVEFAGNRKDIKRKLLVANYERELVQVSLTEWESLPGEKYVGHDWIEEAVGGGAATAAPWHPSVQGCGFAKTQLKVASYDTISVSPTFHIGQTIGNNATQGSATKTGIFVCFEGLKMVYVPLTGTFAIGDTISNYGATVQSNVHLDGAPANAGYRLQPVTETDSTAPPTLSIDERDSGLRWTGIGSRGTGGLTLNRSEPALFNFSFQGAMVFDTNGKTPRAASAMTGIAALTTKPALVLGIPLAFRVGETDYSPVMTKLEFKFGNTLAMRATIGPSLANSGFLATRITARKMTASVDPEFVAPGTFDYTAKFVGGDTFEILGSVGSAANANGKIIVHAPKAQMKGSMEQGDRDGIDTVDTEAMLAGTNDDEFYIYHVFVA